MGYADDLIKVLSSSPSRSIYTQKGYDAVRELLAERDRYRAALAWYADPKNYANEYGELYGEVSNVTEDDGRRAREALNEGAVT